MHKLLTVFLYLVLFTFSCQSFPVLCWGVFFVIWVIIHAARVLSCLHGGSEVRGEQHISQKRGQSGLVWSLFSEFIYVSKWTSHITVSKQDFGSSVAHTFNVSLFSILGEDKDFFLNISNMNMFAICTELIIKLKESEWVQMFINTVSSYS